MIKLNGIKLIFFTLLSLIPLMASAWDGAVGGKVSEIDVTDGDGYGFRVSLVGNL